MKDIILAIIFITLSFTKSLCAEWVRILDPKSVKIVLSPTNKVVEIETWKLRGHKNFINLSFWDGRGPVGRLYIDSIDYGKREKKWPVLCLDPYLGEYKNDVIKTGFSGSNVLVRNSKEIKQGKTFFARRRCPRTGVGITKDGELIIIVSTSSTLKQFAKRFVENGATFAINVDGGSSTMFIENGVSLWKSKRSAVPVILTW